MDFKRIKMASSGKVNDGGLLDPHGIGKSIVKNYRDFNIQTIAGMQNIKYKSPIQTAGQDHLLQIQTCKAELSIFSLTKNAYAFL